MTFTINSFQIIINDKILVDIQKYKQLCSENESGGILFGKKKEKAEEYHIVDLTFPNENDSSTRFSFLRNAKAAQIVINNIWEESDGYINYIGEWHTHPEKNPTPSGTDIKTYKKISKDSSSLFPISINIIFGNANIFYICGYKNGKMVFEERVRYE